MLSSEVLRLIYRRVGRQPAQRTAFFASMTAQHHVPPNTKPSFSPELLVGFFFLLLAAPPPPPLPPTYKQSFSLKLLVHFLLTSVCSTTQPNACSSGTANVDLYSGCTVFDITHNVFECICICILSLNWIVHVLIAHVVLVMRLQLLHALQECLLACRQRWTYQMRSCKTCYMCSISCWSSRPCLIWSAKPLSSL